MSDHTQALKAFFTEELGTLSEPSARRLEAKMRWIHAERPDLNVPEILAITQGVMEGEVAEARVRLACAEAKSARTTALLEEQEIRLASMWRIGACVPVLQRIDRQYPGRATVAEMLRAAGVCWADLGLSEEDGALVQRLVKESAAEEEDP
ncbi:hypothetical protein ACH4FX_41390 [Streptomyces sp. NPDC018019]|uniref:hypothetical protein n=1 Tax=Streptomyces sp. NPDC018019 TaxID=3365030 RepID=UPI00378CD4E8